MTTITTRGDGRSAGRSCLSNRSSDSRPARDDSPSTKSKRKRRVSADGVKAPEPLQVPASSFTATRQDPGQLVEGPLPSAFRSGRRSNPPHSITANGVNANAALRRGSQRENFGGTARNSATTAMPTTVTTSNRSGFAADPSPGRGESRISTKHSLRDSDASATVAAATNFPSRSNPNPNHHTTNISSVQHNGQFAPTINPHRDQYSSSSSATRETLSTNPFPRQSSPDSNNNDSGSGSRRPRKQSRGPDSSVASEDMLQRQKQDLLEKLRNYGSSQDEDYGVYDSDEGDVSGEDVFSEDDYDDNEQQQQYPPIAQQVALPSSLQMSSFLSASTNPYERAPVSHEPQPGRDPKIAESVQAHRMSSASVGGVAVVQKQSSSHGHGCPPSQSSFKGYPSSHSSSLGYSLSVATAQSGYHPPSLSAAERKIKEIQGRASQPALGVFAQRHSNMYEQYNGKLKDAQTPSNMYEQYNGKLKDAQTPSNMYKQYNGKPQDAHTPSNMCEQYNGKPQEFNTIVSHPYTGVDSFYKGLNQSITSAPTARGTSFHSKMSSRRWGGTDTAMDLTKKEERSRGIFASLEAQIIEKESPFLTSESGMASASSLQQMASTKKIPPTNGSSGLSRIASLYPPNRDAAGVPFYDKGVHGSIHPNGALSLRGTASPPSFPNHGRATSRSASRAGGHVGGRSRGAQSMRYGEAPASPTIPSNVAFDDGNRLAGRLSSTSDSKTLPQTLKSGTSHQSPNVIANIEATFERETAAVVAGRTVAAIERESARSSLVPTTFHRRISSSHTTAQARDLESQLGPSREVIASIEADMMRLEEEEESNGIREMDTIRHRGYRHGFPGAHPGSIHVGGIGQSPAEINQGDVLNMMMMQQHQHQSQHHLSVQTSNNQVGNNRTLTDQISNMAIGPQHYSSDKSIDSCVSYDGKCTNIFASRAQTDDQELACHALNDAICDLYGAPVGGILGRCPMVTRLIRGDDEMGNVQLHYAVRQGNVKAIRRIVRADPGCALIRNIQGYCPLHLAVQIGNFAAVKELCCMVPASAEVQCEEGCLPLHEAVSSAAHLPDAPQIVASLINAFPSAIKITSDEGLLPLHLAAISGFSAGIRTIFAYGFSTIYARENTEEMLPVDFAIDGYMSAAEEAYETLPRDRRPNKQASNDTELTEKEMEFRHCIDIFLMSALYDRPVFTPAVRNDQRDMSFLPIHGAAASQPCGQSWKQIISMYGMDYASGVDVRGRTALHVLVTSKPWHLEVVTEMIWNINELDPTCATTFDDSGLLPLHTALASHATYHVVENLLLCNRGTVCMEVDDDCDNVKLRGMLPFQLAAVCGCDVEVVDLLLRAHPIGVAGALQND